MNKPNLQPLSQSVESTVSVTVISVVSLLTNDEDRLEMQVVTVFTPIDKDNLPGAAGSG